MSPPVEPGPRAFDVGGRAVPVWEPEGGTPTVLAVHGGPDLGSAYLRRHLPPAMPEGVGTAFLNLPGAGRARGWPGATFADMTHAVAAVARGLGPPVVLLAHSFGALPTLAAAPTSSPGPAGVILVDPDPPSRPEWEAAFSLLDARRSPEERHALALMEAAGAPRASVEEAETYLRLRLAAYFADPTDAEALQPGLECDDLPVLGRLGAAVRADPACWSVGERLGAVRTPVLIVSGPSGVYPPAAHRHLADALPDAELVHLPGTGHFPFLEAPDGFRRVVARFLTTVADGSP